MVRSGEVLKIVFNRVLLVESSGDMWTAVEVGFCRTFGRLGNRLLVDMAVK